MVAKFGTAKYGEDRFAIPIVITASVGTVFVSYPPVYNARYDVRDYETSSPTVVSTVQVGYTVDVKSSFNNLTLLRGFEDGDLLRAEDMQFNFELLRDVVGDDATNDQVNFTPVAHFGAASISARGDDALYIGYQAEENPTDDGLTFIRPHPDRETGSTLVKLDGDGLHVSFGDKTTGADATMTEKFAITPEYILFPQYTIYENVVDPEEPTPTTTTTTTTPRPRPTTTTTPKPDNGFAGKIRYVNATDSLALRSGPGLNYGVIYYMPHCTKLVVQSGGATSANGYEWWPVKDGSGRKGWCAAMYLSSTCYGSAGGGDGGSSGGNSGGTTANPNEGRDGGSCYYSYTYGIPTGTETRSDGVYFCYRDEEVYICYGQAVRGRTIRTYCERSRLQPN